MPINKVVFPIFRYSQSTIQTSGEIVCLLLLPSKVLIKTSVNFLNTPLNVYFKYIIKLV